MNKKRKKMSIKVLKNKDYNQNFFLFLNLCKIDFKGFKIKVVIEDTSVYIFVFE